MSGLTPEQASELIATTLGAYGYIVERLGALTIRVATRKWPQSTRTLVRVRTIGKIEVERESTDVIEHLQQHILDAFAGIQRQDLVENIIDAEIVEPSLSTGTRRAAMSRVRALPHR